MNTTYDRETFVRSATADLSRQIDDILDRRFERSQLEAEEKPKEPNPIAIVRTLIRGLVHK